MALIKQGDWWHADSANDLDEYLLKQVLGKLCRGGDHRVVHARCAKCGESKFDLFVDNESRIMRQCTSCEADWKICDLDGELVEDDLGEIVCTCMYSECEVAVGFSLRKSRAKGSVPSVTYLYVAGRCTECGLCGIYGEWAPDQQHDFEEWRDSV